LTEKLTMSLSTITPAQAKQLVDQGALLVDIRGPDEYAREHIPGAQNKPLDTLTAIKGVTGPIVFHCKSGNRTTVNAAKLGQAADCESYIVEGGIEGWKVAGLPVTADAKQPIEIQRQMQIAAGSLVLLGIVLHQYGATAFLGLSAFVGAGLVFAGVTGWCGMAKLLSVMPWNRRPVSAG
jgi:rhodanese-related sulfurtransferase